MSTSGTSVASELRKADLVRVRRVRVGGVSADDVGMVMDVYDQPQIGKRFIQVLIGETINWYPETSCELVQRGSYVVE
jgi:hypothetical protein